MRPKLIVEKLNGGLGRRNSTNDMLTGVVMNAVETNTTMELGKVYTFLTITEVEDLGITAEYDQVNSVLVYERLKRLFLHNPSITLYVMFVAQEVTLTDMADKSKDYLAKVLRSEKGKIVQAMIARNPDEDYVPTIETGLDKDSIDAIYKLQELSDFEWDKDRYCEFFVEGRSFSGASSTLLDLRTLTNACPDVSVVLFADNDISKRNTLYNGYAAVEDFVGMLSKAAVSQNCGELSEEFNLTNVANKIFLNPGLSSGAHIDTFSDEALDQINSSGYIIAGYEDDVDGVSGVYITDTHTCDKLDSDFAYVENNRTIKKAIKLCKSKVKPRIKARIYVDEDTGQIAPDVAKDIEKDVKTALRQLQGSGDISGGIDAYVDPAQNVLATSELIILATFIPVAIGRKITLKIGFKNPLNT